MLLPGIVAVVLLALPGCGIETIPFIEGPEGDRVTAVTATATIEFFHNNSDANQTDDFLGYELYYKFYDNGSGPEPELTNDFNSILAEPVPTGTSRLTNRGYRRIIRGTAAGVPIPDAIPVILVTNKSSDYAIDLDFFETAADPTDENATATWDDGSVTTITLRRNSDPTDGIYKSFFGTYVEADDEDVDDDIAAAAGTNDLGVAIYALGYGIEGGTFRQLYSEAVFLGYLVLQ